MHPPPLPSVGVECISHTTLVRHTQDFCRRNPVCDAHTGFLKIVYTLFKYGGLSCKNKHTHNPCCNQVTR